VPFDIVVAVVAAGMTLQSRMALEAVRLDVVAVVAAGMTLQSRMALEAVRLDVLGAFVLVVAIVRHFQVSS
jgi:hypothetical protein